MGPIPGVYRSKLLNSANLPLCFTYFQYQVNLLEGRLFWQKLFKLIQIHSIVKEWNDLGVVLYGNLMYI